MQAPQWEKEEGRRARHMAKWTGTSRHRWRLLPLPLPPVSPPLMAGHYHSDAHCQASVHVCLRARAADEKEAAGRERVVQRRREGGGQATKEITGRVRRLLLARFVCRTHHLDGSPQDDPGVGRKGGDDSSSSRRAWTREGLRVLACSVSPWGLAQSPGARYVWTPVSDGRLAFFRLGGSNRSRGREGSMFGSSRLERLQTPLDVFEGTRPGRRSALLEVLLKNACKEGRAVQGGGGLS